jgi:hypothetical protein
MNRKLAFTLPLLVLLCMSFAGNALAQERVPGVASEDYFTYHMRAYYANVNRNAPVPSDLALWNTTLSYEVKVSGFEATNITTEDKVTFANGTVSPAVIVQDIASGRQLFMRGLLVENFIGANLSPNDIVFPAEVGDLRKVNSTIILDYGATTRDTNTVSFVYPLMSDENEYIGDGTRVDHFDKATGVLVGRYENTLTETENITITMSLQQTNRWVITKTAQIVDPDAPDNSGMIQIFGVNVSLPLLIGVVAVVLVVFVVIVPWVVLKSRRNRRRHHR